ncbi:MAG: DUF6879 family protein, partial [Pseudonocardiaceae bacterium]
AGWGRSPSRFSSARWNRSRCQRGRRADAVQQGDQALPRFGGQLTRHGWRRPARHRASKLLLPGNDFWMFDRQAVAFTHFSGDGHVLDHQVTTDPNVVETCATAFEDAWKIAIPHHEYTPT